MTAMVGLTPRGKWRETLWKEVSARLKNKGSNRSSAGCRAQWCRGLREKTKMDERRPGPLGKMTASMKDLEKRREKRISLKVKRGMPDQANPLVMIQQEICHTC